MFIENKCQIFTCDPNGVERSEGQSFYKRKMPLALIQRQKAYVVNNIVV